MKIEKISDNQIRCTLYRADLLDREIRISELAYGSEKAKELFREMMQQASFEVGFDAEDIPLMIEAIPISTDCLMLIITKVEDPEELDTRFAKFTQTDDMPYYDSNANIDDHDDESDDSESSGLLNLFQSLNANSTSSEDETTTAKTDDTEDTTSKEKTYSVKSSEVIKIFSFNNLDEVVRLAKVVANAYFGNNTLYKDQKISRYYVLLKKSDHSSEEFRSISDLISEYGRREKVTYASKAYFDEHLEIVIKEKALQILSGL